MFFIPAPWIDGPLLPGTILGPIHRHGKIKQSDNSCHCCPIPGAGLIREIWFSMISRIRYGQPGKPPQGDNV